MWSRRLREGLRRASVAAAFVVPIVLQACAAPQRTEPIDMDHEMDSLHACALQTFDAAGVEVEESDASTRRHIGVWSLESEQRERTETWVFFHPQRGPGVQVSLVRHSWSGHTTPMLGAPLIVGEDEEVQGWLIGPRFDEDADYEDEWLRRIVRCWQQSRAEL